LTTKDDRLYQKKNMNVEKTNFAKKVLSNIVCFQGKEDRRGGASKTVRQNVFEIFYEVLQRYCKTD